ncbi:MAG: SPOR domain-containing protein [Bacteroidota bacterium]
MRNFFSVLFFTLSFLFTLAAPTAGPGIVAFYDGSFEQLKSNAHQEQKPYLLSFHDAGIPSRNLERFTYTNPQLANYVANNYLAMQFSIDDLDEVAEKLIDRYQIILFPTIVLFSPEGKMLYRFTGFTGDQAFIKMLETYRYQAETDMSMTFPPEPYIELEASSSSTIEDASMIAVPETELVIGDLDSEDQSTETEVEEFEITELIDLGSPQAQAEAQTDTQASETNKLSEIPLIAEAEVVESLPEIVPESNLIIQTGVYSEFSNAQKEQKRIHKTYTTKVSIDQLQINGRTLFRVKIGPFTQDQEATDLLQEYNSVEKYDAIIKTQ